MKNQFYLSIIFLLFSVISRSQELIVNSRFGTTYTHEQGGLVVTSTLAPVVFGESIQNNIIVVTDHLLFPFSSDTTFTVAPGILKGITAYPNPVPDIFILHRELTTHPYLISVFDAAGKEISKQNWEDGTDMFPVSFKDRSRGVYIVRIVDLELNLQRSFKIIKQ